DLACHHREPPDTRCGTGVHGLRFLEIGIAREDAMPALRRHDQASDHECHDTDIEPGQRTPELRRDHEIPIQMNSFLLSDECVTNRGGCAKQMKQEYSAHSEEKEAGVRRRDRKSTRLNS